MKSKILPILLLAGLVVSCGPSGDPSTPTTGGSEPTSGTSIESPYTIKITAIGSTTIQVTKTLTLRTTVSGTTQKDVTWSSENPEIATVSDRGVVTGVGAGVATIKATLNIDPNCVATIKVTVEEAAKPTSITITGNENTAIGWVGEALQLSATAEPAEASGLVSWETSDDKIATVSDDGLVTFLSRGDVVITATSVADTSIYDSAIFTVKYGTFDTSRGSPNWDYAWQDEGEDSYIEISASDPALSGGFHSAWFAHKKSTKFFAEATFKVHQLTTNTWDWQGFGLGSGISDGDSRFFTYSPHSPVQTNNNNNKIILRDRPESWGALTNRTQQWGIRDLDSITLDDEVKISMIRDGNNYYYLLNDQVYWFDINDKYDGIETAPYVLTYDIPVKVTKYSYSTDAAEIDQILQGDEYKKTFYASNSFVKYESDAKFSFTSLNHINKDHRVASIGDKGFVVKNFEVEFDVKDMTFNNEKSGNRGLTINFSRYDNADVVDSICIGPSGWQDNDRAIVGRFQKWSWPQSYEAEGSVSDWFETTETVKADAGEKSHVKVRRYIENEISWFTLEVDGVSYKVPESKNGKYDLPRSTYLGGYLVWLGGEYSTCSIENFVFRSDVE